MCGFAVDVTPEELRVQYDTEETGSITPPTAVADFISRFDAQYYPGLDAEYEDGEDGDVLPLTT